MRRSLSVARATVLELRRDVVVLLLTVSVAPLLIGLYWLTTQSAVETYPIAVSGNAAPIATELEALTGASGESLIAVVDVPDAAAAERAVLDGSAVVGLELPADFVEAVRTGRQARVVVHGDLSDPRYGVAFLLVSATIEEYVAGATGDQGPVEYVEIPAGDSGARTDFDLYVPGIIVFAVIMLVFPAAMLVARQVETGVLERIRLTALRTSEYLTGIALVVVGLGVVSLALTFITAVALGFRSEGSLWAALLIGVLTAVSIGAVGLIVAAFARTGTQAFVLANLPLALLMFLSGAMFPIPRAELFVIAGHGIAPVDLLPTTHAVAALRQVLTLGAGLDSVAWEVGWLAILTAVFFALGVVLFRRRALR